MVAGAVLAGMAADPSQVAVQARTDLQGALEELATLRRQIEEERLPLARRLHEIEDQVAAARKDVDRLHRTADNELVELNVLRAKAQSLSNRVASVEGLLAAYRDAFNTRLHVSEAPLYEAAVARAGVAQAAAGMEPAGRLEAQLKLLNVGLDRIERLLGGDRFEGEALNPAGRLEAGTFILLGPLAWFAGEGEGAAGVAQLQLNSPAPEIVPVPAALAAGIRQVARQGEGALPLDASMGNALKIQATHDPLWVHIRKGGPVMAPILLLGFSALVIFAIKWVQVSRVKTVSPGELEAILADLEKGDDRQAAARARSVPGPVGRMLEAAIPHARQPKEYIEEVMYEKMLGIRAHMERLLPFLALAAAAAPLLGLLGTVTGMINTFNMITVFGTGDPKTLAGGISEALITTEFGLVVAIPSLLLHAVLSRKVKGLLGAMEQLTVAFINGLPEPSNGPARDAFDSTQPVPNHA
ncbi:MAG: MotA/TolQ/ExbB proton channel family protein [Verrucomicrobia bacterium]|nr:MAG: MotA/TolQ/ExbB proton channel family protein [Verrucomicrobiota bacterium]